MNQEVPEISKILWLCDTDLFQLNLSADKQSRQYILSFPKGHEHQFEIFGAWFSINARQSSVVIKSLKESFKTVEQFQAQTHTSLGHQKDVEMEEESKEIQAQESNSNSED